MRAENAHLLALHYQLNPHFLFNALNSLCSRIFADQDQAAGLVDRFTAFCRQTLTSRPDGIETVGDECAMLQDYLAIEQSRWRENLNVTLDFDPDLFDRRRPSFLLLPLIENALKYGAETSEEKIAISVSIRHQDSDTIIATTTNSGEWIVPGTANRRTSTRVGLTNLRERLARWCPEYWHGQQLQQHLQRCRRRLRDHRFDGHRQWHRQCIQSQRSRCPDRR